MKYRGLFLVVLALLSMACILIIAIPSKPGVNMMHAGDKDIMDLISEVKVSPDELENVELASKQLDSLFSFQDTGRNYTNLIGTPPPEPVISEPVIQKAVIQDAATSEADKTLKSDDLRHKYRAKMVFMSQDGRYAVVDDYFLREGDILPDNGKVVKISQGQVLIKKDGVQQIAVVPKSMPVLVQDGMKHNLP